MNIEFITPRKKCDCKICGHGGVFVKNIGEYCYVCLRKYKVDYPEYITSEQYYMFMKEVLKKEFDK